MAECQDCDKSSSIKSIYPAIAIAAIAGVALTYFFMSRKNRSADGTLPVDKVVNICNSAAERLEAFASQALAS